MKCKRCGIDTKRKSNAQKYCSDCAIVVNREKTRINMAFRRNLGTSDFYEHAYVDDFDREKREIRKELRKHGIKRQFS